jgi:hypothetical protein
MPRLPFRVAMFLSSFSPLFVLMAYENRDALSAAIPLLAATGIGLLGLAVVMWQLRAQSGPQIKVRDSFPLEGEVLAYIAVYLVPFLNVDLAQRESAIAFVFFLFILCVVYVNSNMLFVNPVLSLRGYHSFEVIDKDGHKYALISRTRGLDPGTIIKPAHVDRYLRVDASRRT